MTIFAIPDNSPQGFGFYPTELHGAAIAKRKGAVEITAARHEQLMEAQSEGKQLFLDDDGTPRFRERRIAANQLRENLAQQIRAEAHRRIDATSPTWRQMNDMRQPSEAGFARFAQIDAIREASDLIEAQLADLTAAQLAEFTPAKCPLWPEIF